MRRKARRFLLWAAVVAVVLWLVFGTGNHKTIKLSELSLDEQLSFLQEQGIEGADEHPDFINSVIAHVEENPDHPISISNPLVEELGLQVKDAVNNYYQRSGVQPIIEFFKNLYEDIRGMVTKNG